jgi:nitrogen fixation protein NifU and related proteins
MSTPYGAVLLEHFRRPHNFGSLPEPVAGHEVLNSLCGDRIRLEIGLAAGAIEARFRGDACAICIAAASLMTDLVEGRTPAEAGKLTGGEILAALQAPIPSARLRCALLPLEALEVCLERLGSGQSPAAGSPGSAPPLP